MSEPVVIEVPYVTLRQIDTFWSKVDTSGGPDACWPWLGYRNRSGYGRLLIGSRSDGSRQKALSHRVAYWIENGKWPEPCGMHTCDNRACCNPAHIRPGTQRDNLADMRSKGRARDVKGESHPRHKLRAEDVCDLRSHYAMGIRVADIARHYGISFAAAKMAAVGGSWRHVECNEK